MTIQSLESLNRVKPRHLTLERVSRFYDQAIEVAEATTKQCGMHTLEGRFAVTQAIATAYILKYLIRDPRLFVSPLYKDTGGPATNPHRVIDNIGRDIFYKLQENMPLLPGKVYIEENHQWLNYIDTEFKEAALAVNIDTLDGTSNIEIGHRDQASAIMITNLKLNRFLGGSIVSLVDDALITIEPDNVRLFKLRESYNKAHPVIIPPLQHDKMSLATLGRHLTSVVPFPFNKNPYTPDLLTFGGYGLIKVATGQISTMFDATGQVWYEADMWGLMAEKLGLQVSDFENRRYDWFKKLRESQQPEFCEREHYPIVISYNERMHWQFLDTFLKVMRNKSANLNLN